jgi:hypothetical protein
MRFWSCSWSIEVPKVHERVLFERRIGEWSKGLKSTKRFAPFIWIRFLSRSSSSLCFDVNSCLFQFARDFPFRFINDAPLWSRWEAISMSSLRVIIFGLPRQHHFKVRGHVHVSGCSFEQYRITGLHFQRQCWWPSSSKHGWLNRGGHICWGSCGFTALSPRKQR